MIFVPDLNFMSWIECNSEWNAIISGLELKMQSLNKNEKIISKIDMSIFIVSLVRNGSPFAVTIDSSGFHLWKWFIRPHPVERTIKRLK